MERKDKKWFKRDIIVLISFLILFVSISFLVNIANEMSLRGSVNLAVPFFSDSMVIGTCISGVFSQRCKFLYTVTFRKDTSIANRLLFERTFF